MPELFGDEGHERMQQAQRRFHRGENIAPRGYRGVLVRAGQLRLDPLDIPIAEIAPEEVINDVRRFVEAKFFERFVNFGRDVREPREHPAID